MFAIKSRTSDVVLETPRDAFIKSLGSARSRESKVSARLGFEISKSRLGSPSEVKSRDFNKKF
jgi:hypothetical protein